MKRIFLIVGVIFLMLFTAGCARKEAGGSYSLRLKWIYDPGFAGEIVAKHQNFYSKAGLTIDIKPGGFESDPIKLVASGADAFGVAGADTFLIARSRGVPIVAFAAGYIRTPVVYYFRPESGIKRFEDFRGKRVGVQAGQDTETIYHSILRKVGMSASDVIEVPVKYDFTPFLDGRLDVWPGYAATQSFTLAEKQIPYGTLAPADVGITYVGTVYFTTNKLMQEFPEVVQAFLNATLDGWKLAYENMSITEKALAALDPSSMTPKLVQWNMEKQLPSILPKGRKYGEITHEDITSMLAVMQQEKMLAGNVDVNAAFNDRFLKAYYKK